MSLSERLMADLRDAMRSKDRPRREAIRMVRAAVKNAEIEAQRELSDEEIEGVIAREVKQRKEATEMFRQAGRDDLVAEEETQLAILQQYLPEQLSRDEIVKVVQRIISEVGADSMQQLGPVMGRAMAELKGKADGHLVNQIARELLSH